MADKNTTDPGFGHGLATLFLVGLGIAAAFDVGSFLWGLL